MLPAILAEAIFLKLHLLMDTFRRLDKDNSGKLSRDEFVLGMEKMGLTSDQGHQLFKMVDKDRSGEVELSELLAMRDAVAKRERAKRLEDDDEVGEVVDGTLLQMLRNYVLGFVWQTPPPLVPHDPERTLQRAERSGDSAADVFKDGPLVVPLSGHIKEVEKAIAFRINRMFTEVEALAATVQLAAIKDQEVALTMRDECKRHADALARYRSFLDQTWAALDGVKMRLAPLVEDAPGEGDWVHFGPVSRATALPPARRPAEAASECMYNWRGSGDRVGRPRLHRPARRRRGAPGGRDVGHRPHRRALGPRRHLRRQQVHGRGHRRLHPRHRDPDLAHRLWRARAGRLVGGLPDGRRERVRLVVHLRGRDRLEHRLVLRPRHALRVDQCWRGVWRRQEGGGGDSSGALVLGLRLEFGDRRRHRVGRRRRQPPRHQPSGDFDVARRPRRRLLR